MVLASRLEWNECTKSLRRTGGSAEMTSTHRRCCSFIGTSDAVEEEIISYSLSNTTSDTKLTISCRLRGLPQKSVAVSMHRTAKCVIAVVDDCCRLALGRERILCVVENDVTDDSNRWPNPITKRHRIWMLSFMMKQEAKKMIGGLERWNEIIATNYVLLLAAGCWLLVVRGEWWWKML